MIEKKYSRLKTCPYCESKLEIEDIDFSFKGCQDEYYLCTNEKCNTAIRVKVRYDKDCKYTAIDTCTGEIKGVIKI